jgi:hypothetical protein
MLSSNRNLQVSELPLTLCLEARALPIVIVFGVLGWKDVIQRVCCCLLWVLDVLCTSG